MVFLKCIVIVRNLKLCNLIIRKYTFPKNIRNIPMFLDLITIHVVVCQFPYIYWLHSYHIWFMALYDMIAFEYTCEVHSLSLFWFLSFFYRHLRFMRLFPLPFTGESNWKVIWLRPGNVQWIGVGRHEGWASGVKDGCLQRSSTHIHVGHL